MPLPYTRADAVRLLHTGAASNAAAQADPDASLGGYCSSTRCGGRAFIIDDAQVGVRVDFISGDCEPGIGSITAAGADELRFAAPGGSPGAAIAIGNGETRLLEDGDDPDHFAIVTRVDDADLGGSTTLRLVETLNSAIAGGNANINSGPIYRCVGFRAGNAAIEDLKIWIAAADHPVAIAREDPASQPGGAVQTIASETTAPTGRTFVSPDSAGHMDVISLDLAPGQWVGIWIRRDLSAMATATPWADIKLGWQYTATG